MNVRQEWANHQIHEKRMRWTRSFLKRRNLFSPPFSAPEQIVRPPLMNAVFCSVGRGLMLA
jgi:hypothetical protein